MTELDEEYYLHFAGHKETLDLEQIYARHAELATLETAQELGTRVNGDRRRRELWRFSSEGYLGNLTREHAEREAALEAALGAYGRAQALAPERADVYRQLGLLHHQRRDAVRARAAFEEYVRRAPDAADARRVAEYARELRP
jgi:hypothetical protein